MKTLEDVKQDMSLLYDEVRSGAVELKTASELANIAGKFLKAEQLQLAKLIFSLQIDKRFIRDIDLSAIGKRIATEGTTASNNS